MSDPTNGAYAEIRKAIDSGGLDEAERLLALENNRGAEWYFLMGSLYYKKGWLDMARQHFDQAANMEPDNREYQKGMEQMKSGKFAYGDSKDKDKGSGYCEDDCYKFVMCKGCCACAYDCDDE